MRTETIEIGLYLVSAGLLGILVLEGLAAQNSDWIRVPAGKELSELSLEIAKEGRSRRQVEQIYRYGEKQMPWWQRVELANWHGYVKPVVDPTNPTIEAPPLAPILKPLSEIVTIVVVLVGAGEERVKVRYEDPDVQAPQPEGMVPGPAQPGTVSFAMPGTKVYQDLGIGDALYDRYREIRLARIAPDGTHAVFSRPAPEGQEGRVEEKLTVAELLIDVAHFAGVGGLTNGAGSANAGSSRVVWQDPGETTKLVGANTWMFSRKDSDWIERDYDRILVDDLGLQSYTGLRRAGRDPIRGVVANRVSKRVQDRFGIRPGDVLIKVNGLPVKSKASAINVGKREYKRGVRTFTLTFLTSGGSLVDRTYRAPDK